MLSNIKFIMPGVMIKGLIVQLLLRNNFKNVYTIEKYFAEKKR